MLGFDPLSLSAAYILASLGATCPAPAPPATSVRFFIEDHPVMGIPTSQELTSLFIHDLNSTMLYHGKWMTGGATSLHLKERIKVEFRTRPAPDGAICLSVGAVTYTVVYSPVVYIANDLSACVEKAARAHEQRHMDADIAAINAFLPALEKAINDDIGTLGTAKDALGNNGMTRPIAIDDIKAAKSGVTAQILKAVEPHWRSLPDVIRSSRLSDDDSEKVYKEDTAACPGAFPPFVRSY